MGTKFDLDVWYVDNQSTWLDFKILFLTFKKVLIREGINTNSDKPMPMFKGLKKVKNILITSVGRRVELVQFFQLESKKLSKGTKIYCTDQNPKLSSACQLQTIF